MQNTATPPHWAQGPAGSALPEFCDSKQARQLFGFTRSHLYALASQGLIRSVSIRRPGAARGKKLWDCANLRAFLNKRATGGEQEGKDKEDGQEAGVTGES
jgi:hypothetical protein